MTGVTVVIPVGPQAHHKAFLGEALQSVADQTRLPDELLLIDDMASVVWDDWKEVAHLDSLTVWRAPWRLGVASAFNAGVGLAKHPLVIMLGADDKLLPKAVAACVAQWEANGKADAYYYMGVEYSDGRPSQTTPCNAVMITKGLWQATGGFPPETASGANDCALVSILMVHSNKQLVAVADGSPLYWYRVHENSDTAGRGPWQGVILETRDILTRDWKAPKWGRYT